MIQLRALRLTLLNRIWTMTKFGICWRHHCTCRREKQLPTDHEFIALSEKTQCPVHLMSVKVLGNLPRCSHTKENRVKTHFPTEKALPQDIKQFREMVNLSSDSLIRKLREQFLKNKEIINSQKQNLKSWSKNVKLVLATLAFVNFYDKIILIVRNWSIFWVSRISKRAEQAILLEEFVWREKHFETLASENFPWSGRSEERCWEKVTLPCRSSLHKHRSCRKGWIVWKM